MSEWRVFTDGAGTLPIPGSIGGPHYPIVGGTQNFQVFSQRVLGTEGARIGSKLLTDCEANFVLLKQLFGVTPSNLPFKVYVTQDTAPGAMHYGCMGTEIYISTKSSPATSNGYRLLLQAELVEVFEAAIGNGWNCGYNNGEGLSRVLATDSYPADELKPFVTSNVWLDKTPPGRPRRENWVDKIDPEDTNQFSIGCSVLFLNWMRWMLGSIWHEIVDAGAPTLAGTYEKLFLRDDAWVRFKAEVDARFPEGSPSGLTTDNPFRRMLPS